MIMTLFMNFIGFIFLLFDLRIKIKLKSIDIIVITLVNICYYVPVNSEYSCHKPELDITVLPKEKDLYIHWNIEKIKVNDWIGFYKGEFTESNPNTNLIQKYNVETEFGTFQTHKLYEFKVPKEKKYKVEERCLGYYAVYWRIFPIGTKVVVWTCFKTNPTWMEHYWNVIKDRPVNRLFIPGSHDSCSYEGIKHSVSKKAKSSTNTIDRAKSFIKHATQKYIPLINNYAITQDSSIFKQLMLGIRYLDIRAFLDDKTYWTHHGGFYMVPLDNVISEVVNFVLQTEKEVIIFDIHEIIGKDAVSNEEHEKFIKWLKEKFSYDGLPLWIDHSSKHDWDMTLEEITSNGGRIIVTYNDMEHQERFKDFLWPAVSHIWGNKNNVKELIDFLVESMPKEKDKAYAFMAELTMDVPSVIKTSLQFNFDGLRDKADIIAQHIYYLFKDYDMASKTNILAVDFLRAMGVVREAMIWNVRLASNRKDDKGKQCDPIEFYGDTYYQHNELSLDLLEAIEHP